MPGKGAAHPDSVIVGLARVVGCIRANEEGDYEIVAGVSGVHVDVDEEWFFGPYGWILENVVALREPVPCKGAQGLWTVPPDAAARVLEQAPEVVR
jgi:hypothetical protein